MYIKILILLTAVFVLQPTLASAQQATTSPTICCSSVMLIPGFQASRIDVISNLPSGSEENRRWEPRSREDLKDLYLDRKGWFINEQVSNTKMISAYGIKPIYKGLVDSLDELVKDKTITSWFINSYDWRLGANHHELFTNYTIALMARRSKTGKVTIITHSNGGIYLKAQIENLRKADQLKYIDKIIMVAVPEYGTPQAILGLLHGHSQSILGGLIISEGDARVFSQNMPGAYGLLPMRQFFEKNPDTVITDTYSGNKLISTFIGMKEFLLKNTFAVATSSNTHIPLKLNSYIFDKIDEANQRMDAVTIPDSIKTITIRGWGLPTVKGVKYDKNPHCIYKTKSKCDVAYSPEYTRKGDGTVLANSFSSIFGDSIYFNLGKLERDKNVGIKHGNILESRDLLGLIKDLVTGKDVSTSANYSKYVSTTEPVEKTKWLTIRMYSPVDIDVYDSLGNHTGLKPNPDITKSVDKFDTEIPGSFYDDLGGVKVLQIPYEEGYKITIKGNGVGVFSSDMDISVGDQVIASTTFSEMPVSPLLTANIEIPTTIEQFASTTAMYMDVDGDGNTDLVNNSDTYLNSTSTNLIKDLPTYLESIKLTIKAFNLPSSEESKWISRIDKLYGAISTSDIKMVRRIVNRIESPNYKNRNLNSDQIATVLNYFDTLLTYLESTM